jgi:hypothetical protein
MSTEQPKDEKRCKAAGFLCVPDTRPTRIILWLVAIAIVSLAIGFGILAASGNTRVTVVQGVGDIAGAGFILGNGAYTPPGFNPVLPVNEIFVKQGVGDVRLEMV